MIRRGAGLPIVMIHGNGVDHRVLLALDPVLEREGGFERIYLDLPGFGDTPALGGRGGLPELAAWLVDAVPLLVGDRRFAMVGSSLGGLLARHVQTVLPDQVGGLAMLAPVVAADPAARDLPGQEVAEDDESMASILAQAAPDAVAGYTQMAARRTPQTWQGFLDAVLPGLRAADAEAMARLGACYVLDVADEVFEAPTLIVTGRQDHVVGYADQADLWRRAYPNATYVAIHGAGHNVHIDAPDIAAAHLAQWARDVRRVMRATEG